MKRIEYAMIPIAHINDDDYMDEINYHGKQGWIVASEIMTCYDSPTQGVTTKVYLCYRTIPWYRRIFKH